MMVTYKTLPSLNGVPNECVLRSDGAIIPPNPDNTDYQAYLAWVAEGGEVLPADEQGVA